jgi:hypothetical protein
MENHEILSQIDDLDNDKLLEIAQNYSTEAFTYYKNNVSGLPEDVRLAFENVSVSYLSLLAVVVNLQNDLATQNEELIKFYKDKEKESSLNQEASEISNKELVAKTSEDELAAEIRKKDLLTKFCSQEPNNFFQYLLKTSLLQFLSGKEPFPLVKKYTKKKAGRPRITISTNDMYDHYIKNNGSINKTANDLNIDRKTVRERIRPREAIEKDPLFKYLFDLEINKPKT